MHWDSLEPKLHSVAAARDYCPSSPLNASASSGGGVSTSGAMLDEEQKKLKHEAFQRRRKASGIIVVAWCRGREAEL